MQGHLLAGLVISRIGESLGVVEGECEDIGATVFIFEDQVNVMLIYRQNGFRGVEMEQVWLTSELIDDGGSLFLSRITEPFETHPSKSLTQITALITAPLCMYNILICNTMHTTHAWDNYGTDKKRYIQLHFSNDYRPARSLSLL